MNQVNTIGMKKYQNLAPSWIASGWKWLFPVLLALIGTAPLLADQSGDFTYTASGPEITITGYTGTGGSVTIPDTVNGLPVTRIDAKAFQNVASLTSVIIPAGVTSIGDSAFWGCSSLTSASVPASVTSLGQAPFGDCAALTAISVAEDNPNFRSIDGVVFDKGMAILIAYPGGIPGPYAIPNSVTEIGSYAFYGRSGLTTVSFPSNGTVFTIRSHGFYKCTGLTSLALSPGPCGLSIGSYAFSECVSLASLTLFSGPGWLSIGSYAFAACTSLNSITSPAWQGGGSIGISEYAFKNCARLSNITFPSSIGVVGSHLFSGCTSLTSITIPASVSTIEDGAFEGCNSLTAAFFQGTAPSIGADVFGNAASGFKVLFFNSAAGFTTPTWSNYPTTNLNYSSNGSGISITGYSGSGGSLNIPGMINGLAVTGIATNAFAFATGLTSVTIPDSVTSIGSNAFVGCSGLTEVTIPASVTSIGDGAFQGCSKLVVASFLGTAPTLGTNVFNNTAVGFVVYYFNNASGFSYPTWNGYPAADWIFTISDNTVAITGYAGTGGNLKIPGKLSGRPVTEIGPNTFQNTSGLIGITIPATVTSIGSSAFLGCTGLTGITIPPGITKIGNSTFSGCTSLTDITIPPGVTSVGSFAFYGCTGLTSVTIPLGVTSIEDYTFAGCSSLTTVSIPSSVSSIGFCAFASCGLTSVTIPASVTSLGENVFGGCGGLMTIQVDGGSANYSNVGDVLLNKARTTLIQYPMGNPATNFTIPAGVTSIGNNALSGCAKLTSVTIPTSAISIGDNALSGCFGLTSITIPASVTSIGNWAFFGCSGLTGVIIPASVTSIGSRAFGACSKLTTISVDGSNFFYSDRGGVLFNKNQTTLIEYPEGLTGSYVIPTGVTSIGNGAFLNCSAMTGITIPANVTNIGSWAFSGCGGLTNVTLPASITTIGDYAFSYCSSLTKVTFAGNAPVALGTTVFNNTASGLVVYYTSGATGFTSPTWHGYLTVITGAPIVTTPTSANISFTSATLGGSVNANGGDTITSLGVVLAPTAVNSNPKIGGNGVINVTGTGSSGAFTVNVSGLTPATDYSFAAYAINSAATSYSVAGTFKTVSLFDTYISDGSVWIRSYKGPSGAVDIPDRLDNLPVTWIWSSAFSSSSGVTSVTIPASVINLDGPAFQNCTSLMSISVDSNNPSFSSNGGVLFDKNQTTLLEYPRGLAGAYVIPAGVVSIGASAFSYCTGLTGIAIPASVTSIGGSAFFGCSGLTNVTIPAGVTSIGGSAFYYCTGLTSIVIPAGVPSIGTSTFSSCTRLTSVTIPASVTSIGSNAFRDCTSLSSITIPANVASIGDYAFWRCSSLKSAKFLGNAPGTMGNVLFQEVASGFTVYFTSVATGFTTPTWRGYSSAISIGPPYVATPTCTNITGTTVTLGGNVTNNGGAAVSALGVVFAPTAINSNPQLGGTGATTVPGTGTSGVFTVPVIGLMPGTAYTFAAYATNVAGPGYSTTGTFATPLMPPTVTTGSSAATSTTSVRLNGTARAHYTNTKVFFDYGTDGVSFPNSMAATPADVTGDVDTVVTADLSNLLQDITYYYRVRAESAGPPAPPGDIASFKAAILYGLLQQFPPAPPDAQGYVFVTLSPSGIASGWRFGGEQGWRTSGVPAGGLATGDRVIEFRPVPGYIQPPQEAVGVVSGEAAIFLDRTYYVTPTTGSGGLTVTLKPDALADGGVPAGTRAQWRLLGEDDTHWRDSGTSLPGLSPGDYVIECKPVAGRATPPTTSARVLGGQEVATTITYFLADGLSGTQPSMVPFETVTTDQSQPYAYVGQIRSDVGSSSGFVVKARVVATAGHVVFDDGTLSAVTGLQWLFQRHRGTYEPKPQIPRGFYSFDAYAAQRRSENTPGSSSPQSQNLDVAAVYFNEEAGRGGYGGFLASDLDNNEFILSSALKMLVGYPVDRISVSNQGRMYATPPVNAIFANGFGHTYASSSIRSSGGGSGGPLCIQHQNGTWYPAAIYLGGSGQTVVRAIDSQVIELFNRAETSSTGGDNNTGGGITHTSVTGILNPTKNGAIRVLIEPAAARSNGAGWRLRPETGFRSSYDPYGNLVQLSSLAPGFYTLELATVQAFQPPTSQTVQITGGQVNTVVFSYAGNLTPLEIWRGENFGTLSNTGPAADSADPDGDGQPNLAEYAAGTDPNSAAEVFKVLTAKKTGGTFTVTAFGKAERTYFLQRRLSLTSGTWDTVFTLGPLAGAGTVSLTDPTAPSGNAFYRIQATAP